MKGGASPGTKHFELKSSRGTGKKGSKRGSLRQQTLEGKPFLVTTFEPIKSDEKGEKVTGRKKKWFLKSR